MHDAGVPILVAWESFYVIIGSSAAALTGLMFIAITLMGEARGRVPGIDLGVVAFNSPTVVHFCMAFLVSALLSAPWSQLSHTAIALDAAGAGGLIYGFVVLRRMLRMGKETEYELVMEDWIWHIVFPFVAYAMIVVAAVCLERWTELSLFAVAAATLVLLFSCIHNAWDIVTYVTLKGHDKEKPKRGRH
ncbi:MAG TPA: hypothetical protein VGI83_02655 [Gemmatimonadales bacterium]|jgi:hypothetical protein